MKLKMMKRSIVVLAAAFAAMSTSAVAENTPPMTTEAMVSKSVQLSDAELDGITAGNAQVILLNSGNANFANAKTSKHGVHGVCTNFCADPASGFTPPTHGGAFGVVTVENQGQGVFYQIIGRPHFPVVP